MHDDGDDDPTAGGLLSRMTQQLAWERDIDLSKGKPAIRTDTVLEEEEDDDDDEDDMKSSNTSRTYVPSTPTPPPKSAGGKGVLARVSAGVDNPVYEQDKAARISEAFQLRELSDSGAGNPSSAVRRTNRISPETTVIEMSGKKSKRNLLKGHSSRPPSARSSSGGSKQSKDSAFSEEKSRTNAAATSSRSSFNSSTSLTSLLHAWDKQGTSKQTDDDTEF